VPSVSTAVTRQPAAEYTNHAKPAASMASGATVGRSAAALPAPPPINSSPPADPLPEDATFTRLGGYAAHVVPVQGTVPSGWLPGLTLNRTGVPADVNGRGRFVLHGRLPG
jgi:hypothetical protein